MSTAIETHELSKRYRRVSALTECTVTVPAGRVSALVGPNGAGKTTLLRILIGLASPTGGTASVLDGTPRQDPAFLAEIGFLAQEIPLYRRFTAEDHIRIGAHMNPRWDATFGAHPARGVAHSARPARRHAVRRPARPGGTGADAGQAAAVSNVNDGEVVPNIDAGNLLQARQRTAAPFIKSPTCGSQLMISAPFQQ